MAPHDDNAELIQINRVRIDTTGNEAAAAQSRADAAHVTLGTHASNIATNTAAIAANTAKLSCPAWVPATDPSYLTPVDTSNTLLSALGNTNQSIAALSVGTAAVNLMAGAQVNGNAIVTTTAAYASYQMTNHFALPNDTFTTLTNFTPQITSFNMTLANNNRFTVTNAGVYKIDCFFMSNVVPGTLEFFVLQLCDQDNTVLSEVRSLDQLKDTDQQHTLNISNLRHLDAGDFVYINAKIKATSTSRDVLGLQYSNVNIHRVA
jgi:hypothetical protein